jgi:hypothetical protein
MKLLYSDIAEFYVYRNRNEQSRVPLTTVVVLPTKYI